VQTKGIAEETQVKKIKDMVAEANAVVEHGPAAEMLNLHGCDGVTFVDLRDPRELERDGMIPGAFHCPRGMLEFWIDPESPYAKPQFQSGNRFVFYCASGWRSALSAQTAQEMGLKNVSHISDGFKGWQAAGGTVAEKPKKV
jgi:rhodanese-related sulfurtransferase